MEIGGRSFATQDKIESGTFQPMSPRKCALIAFPLDRGAEQQKKVVAFQKTNAGRANLRTSKSALRRFFDDRG